MHEYQKFNRHAQQALQSLIFLILAIRVIQTQPVSTSIASVPTDLGGSQNEQNADRDQRGRSSLSLTAEESAWLDAHSEITVAINQAWPPMDYVDADGTPRGIGVGFIKTLNARLGGRLKVVPLPWTEMVEEVKEKRIDALMDITPRPDREAFFHFTKPYLNIPHSIIALKDAPYYADLSCLAGKTVGIERHFFIEKVLREKYPEIKIELFDTTSDALDAVSRGEADAYAGNRAAVTYLIEKELMANLRVMGRMEKSPR